MKRCPACKRVESDDTLTFCRADGAILISDSNSLGAEIGTVEFGSAPVASEVKTSVLPQHATDAGRATGSTTVLDHQTIGRTRELSRPKRRSAVMVVVLSMTAVVAVAILVGGYFYFSRKSNSAIESIAVG